LRTREEILKDPKGYEQLNQEILLDIRDLLAKKPAQKRVKRKRTTSVGKTVSAGHPKVSARGDGKQDGE
jgi:hypothetical protein